MLANEALKKLDALTLRLRDQARGGAGGLRHSKSLGSSAEFSDFRPYLPGDDIRRVDWNAYARFDRLFLKLFMEEQEAVVHLIMDASGSMAAKWAACVDFTQALGYLALCSGDRVRVWALQADGAQAGPLLSGRKDFLPLCQYTQALTPRGDTQLDSAICRLSPLSKGMSFLISDLFSPQGYQKGLSFLRFQKQQATILHLLSPQELNPRLEGAVRLIDDETGEHLDLMAEGGAMRRYQRALAQFKGEIQAYCCARDIRYLPCTAEDGALDKLLLHLCQLGDLK